MHWLFRAKRWAQNPPSATRVKFALAVVAVVLLLAGIEHLFGWPEALQVERYRPGHLPR